MSSEASLHRIGDATVPKYLTAEKPTLYVSVKVRFQVEAFNFENGTIVLEHLANEPATTEAGPWVVDATFTTDQTRTAVAGTAGFLYRLRATAIPSAGKSMRARLDFSV